MPQNITSHQNQFIKLATSLQDKKSRKKEGLIIFEGWKLLEAALAAELKPEYLFINEAVPLTSKQEELLNNYLASSESKNPKIFKVTAPISKKISTTDSPAPITIITKPPPISILTSNEEIQGKELKAMNLYCEKLQDPGNLGSIIRTAVAADIEEIFISEDSTDIFSPKTIRSSAGAVFYAKINVINSKNLGILKKGHEDIQFLATSPKADQNFNEIQIEKNNPSLLMLGSEAHGLCEQSFSQANQIIKIPLNAKIESLNVLAASSVLLFDLRKHYQ